MSLLYKNRLLNDIEITQQLSDIYWGVTEPQDITLELSNIDKLFSQLYAAGEEFRNKGVKLRVYEPLDNHIISFLIYGKITGVEIGDVARFTVATNQIPEFDVDLPKTTYQTRDWIEAPPTIINPPQDLGKPYNICFGHCKKVPLLNVHWDSDNDYYDFIIGYGTIESNNSNKATTVNVYRNKVLVDPSEYTVYDGSQDSPYHPISLLPAPGFAFIRFVKEQIDFSGNPYELTADIHGLELSGSTAERNFVRVIQYLLSNTTWGLGLSVDTESFDAAAATMAEYLCDGAIIEQRKALDIINELLDYCRGKLVFNEDGEIGISVDAYNPKVQYVFGHKDGTYDNIIDYKTIVPQETIKRLTLNYGWNAWEGTYPYQNKREVFSFGEEKVIECNFIRDHTTADKITSYKMNLALYGDKQMEVTLGMEARKFQDGNVTRILIPEDSIDSNYQIRSLKKQKNTTQFFLQLSEYNSAIYQYIVGDIPDDANDDDLPDYSNTAPAAPTSFQKTGSASYQSSDGTTTAYFNVSAVTALTTNAVTLVKFGYKKTGESAYTFVDGNQSGTTWIGRIDSLVPGLYYDLIAVAYNAYDIPSLGNPTITSQLAPGDTTAPNAPTGLQAIAGIGIVTLTWTKNTENDINHYEVYRGMVKIADPDTTKFVDSNLTYGVNYQYVVKAVDNSKNPSGYSSPVTATPRRTETGDIGNNQVTLPVSAYTDNNIILGVGYTTVQTAVISTVGGAVLINASVILSSGDMVNDSSVTTVIYRDSVALCNSGAVDVEAAKNRPLAFNFLDIPSSGSHTYTIRCSVTGGEMWVGKRSLIVVELKR